MIASSPVFAVSDHAQRMPRRASILRGPAVSEASIVFFDVVEIGVAIAKPFPDTSDEGTDISAITLRPVPGDEVFAVDEIAAPSLADILSRLLGEQSDNFEFSKGQA